MTVQRMDHVGVVVDDLDRLARLDLLELGVLLSPLRKAGVWIEAVAYSE